MKNVKTYKNILLISLSTFLLIGISTAANAESIKEGVVSSNNGLNVREEAAINSKIISVLKYKSSVELLEENGDWYKIKIGSTYGYINKKFITSSSSKKESTLEASATIAEVNNDTEPQSQVSEDSKITNGTVLTEKGLNLREKPDAASKSLAILKPGTKVEILESTNIWCKVKAYEQTGYVSKQYLKPDDDEGQKTQVTNSSVVDGSKPVEGVVLTENGLNLRTKPSLSSKVLTVVSPKSTVKILETAGDWYKLKTDAFEGYSLKQYVKIQ